MYICIYVYICIICIYVYIVVNYIVLLHLIIVITKEERHDLCSTSTGTTTICHFSSSS